MGPALGILWQARFTDTLFSDALPRQAKAQADREAAGEDGAEAEEGAKVDEGAEADADGKGVQVQEELPADAAPAGNHSSAHTLWLQTALALEGDSQAVSSSCTHALAAACSCAGS